MTSFIMTRNLHLMMMEIALFVPWSSEFDKIILKKTTVMFRMLDDEWIPLSPNRPDYYPYRGSNYENENFYGGRSVVFCVGNNFFEEDVNGVDIQFHVRKEMCKYFEMDSCQNVGFVAVPVDDLLNSIAKQIRERNALAEHLSDFYKRQIISRSMVGTYTFLDENSQNTDATISLYIRISYLGKCIITEITRPEGKRKVFHASAETDEEHPYHLQELTSQDFQSGCLPYLSTDHPICRCEKHEIGKETVDSTNDSR